MQFLRVIRRPDNRVVTHSSYRRIMSALQTPCSPVAELPKAARNALEFWRGMRGERRLPDWSGFCPLDWREWMSDLSVIELRDGDPRHFIALHGGRTQDHVGASFHKRFLEDCVTPETRTLALAPYRESERTRLPTFSTVSPVIYPVASYVLYRLVLPFSCEAAHGNAARVSRFVVWVGTESRKPYDMETVYASLQANLDSNEDIADRVMLSVLTD